MENNELLANILQEMQTTNLINKQLIETLSQVQSENKQLVNDNNNLNLHIEQLKNNKDEVIVETRREPTFEDVKPEDIVYTALEINKKQLLEERFNNFKNIVKTQSQKLNQKFSFSDKFSALMNAMKNKVADNINETKSGIAVLMDNNALPSVKTMYVNIRNQFIKKAHEVGVHVQTKAHNNIVTPLQNKASNVYETLFLTGNKKVVAKLKNKFSQSLSLIGLEANDLIYSAKTEKYSSVEEVATTIDEKLASQFKIIKIENEYIPIALQNLDDDMKLEIIKKMLWPKLMKEIESSLGLSLHLNKIKDSNVHMKIIDQFANKNNITLETAIHCLENHDNLLNTYKGVENIVKDKENILNTAEKFEIISRNNFIVLQSLVKAATNLEKIISNLNIENKEETLMQLSKTKVAQDGKKFFSFSTIQKNISKLLANQNFINGVVESNKKIVKPNDPDNSVEMEQSPKNAMRV